MFCYRIVSYHNRRLPYKMQTFYIAAVTMRSYHVVKRGNRYHYVCRVPVDLICFFPISTIYRSLKTSDQKVARLLAASFEHRTQGVFMKLRSGQLDEYTVKKMLTSYLSSQLLSLEAGIKGHIFNDYKSDDKQFDHRIPQTTR